MTSFSRLSLPGLFPLVAVCIIAIAGTIYAVSGMAVDWHLDVWNVAEMHEQMEMDEKLKVELEAKDAAIMRRIQAKESVVADLAAGRRTLLEAAVLFRELNAERPEYLLLIRMTHTGGNDDERMCRNVISFATSALQDNPSLAAEVSARLEAELADMLRREGMIRLP